MTFSKVLAQGKRGKYDVIALESTEKYSSVPHYEIIVADDNFAFEVVKTARTTWKKKFKEMIDN